MPPTATKRGAGIYHVVRPGENLFRIGKAYDVPFEELARLNGIKNAGQIHIGQRIFIAGATRQLPVAIITPVETSPVTPSAPEPEEIAEASLLSPVSGTINSGFGPRGTSFHDGIDIAAPEGTPI
ncbi:MAG TPA: LysM peptidoglycan-binding domain-containing protein, partial [Candidatus Binatia bacterium]